MLISVTGETGESLVPGNHGDSLVLSFQYHDPLTKCCFLKINLDTNPFHLYFVKSTQICQLENECSLFSKWKRMTGLDRPMVNYTCFFPPSLLALNHVLKCKLRLLLSPFCTAEFS